jgi:hypothetical protein
MKFFLALALFASAFVSIAHCSKPPKKLTKKETSSATEFSHASNTMEVIALKNDDSSPLISSPKVVGDTKSKSDSTKSSAVETSRYSEAVNEQDEFISKGFSEDPNGTLSTIMEKSWIPDAGVVPVLVSLRKKHADFDQTFIFFVQKMTKEEYETMRASVIKEMLLKLDNLDMYWERPASMAEIEIDFSADVIAAILKKPASEALQILIKGIVGKETSGAQSQLFGHFCIRPNAPFGNFSHHMSRLACGEGKNAVHSYLSSLIYSNKSEVREARRLFMSGQKEKIDATLVFTEDQQRNNFILLQVLPIFLDSDAFSNLQLYHENANKKKKAAAGNEIDKFVAQGIVLTHLLKFYEQSHNSSTSFAGQGFNAFVKLMKWLIRIDQACAQSVMRQVKESESRSKYLIQFADAEILSLMVECANVNAAEEKALQVVEEMKKPAAEKKVKVAKVKNSVQAKKRKSKVGPAPSQPTITSDVQAETSRVSVSSAEPVHLDPYFHQELQISDQDRSRLLQFQTDFLQATKDLIKNEDKKVQSRILLYLIKDASDIKFVFNTFLSEGYCIFDSPVSVKPGAKIGHGESIYKNFDDDNN